MQGTLGAWDGRTDGAENLPHGSNFSLQLVYGCVLRRLLATELLEDSSCREKGFRASQTAIEEENNILKQDSKQEEERRLRMMVWCRQRAIQITVKWVAQKATKRVLDRWQEHWLLMPAPERPSFFRCFPTDDSPRVKAYARIAAEREGQCRFWNSS